MAIRPKYHLRRTKTGIDAFDVRRLIKLSEHLEPFDIDPRTIPEMDEDHWYFQNVSLPTPRSILEHARLINEADLSFPIILDSAGRVMDGMHRVCRAIMEDVAYIRAVQFQEDPEPDFADCDPQALSYQ